MRSFFTNPLIVKELRERFRMSRTAWIVGIYLFVIGAILLGFMYLNEMNRSDSIPLGDGHDFFMAMAYLQYALICFIAPALSAGSVSGERERQTLNILLTTKISPARIIWSKWITSLAFTVLLIVASMPLYSMVFLYGGLSPGQLAILMLFYLLNILFFGALGVTCSTWLKRTGASTITAYGLAFFFVVGTGLLLLFFGMLVEELYPGQSVWKHFGIQLLSSINPVFNMMIILDLSPMTAQDLDTFLIPPWVTFTVFYSLLTVGLLLFSSYLLRPNRPDRAYRRAKEQN